MKYKHLFGPVVSRRLGISLGVDLVPYKYCPLNCVYCEVQATTNLSVQREEFFPINEILAELDDFLASKPQLDYITFSGAGEPTLYSRLGEVVQYIKVKHGDYKLALLTNGVLLSDPIVRKEIVNCDVVLPSLDAASKTAFAKVTRPHSSLDVNEIIQGLIQFRKAFNGKIWLELFLVPEINDTMEELAALKEAIRQIKPDLVQLNSLDRPGTEKWVKPLSLTALRHAKQILSENSDIPVEIIAKVKYDSHGTHFDEDVIGMIQSSLLRRPCTAEDLSLMLEIHINEIAKVLRQLHLDGKVQAKRESRGVFYFWKG